MAENEHVCLFLKITPDFKPNYFEKYFVLKTFKRKKFCSFVKNFQPWIIEIKSSKRQGSCF